MVHRPFFNPFTFILLLSYLPLQVLYPTDTQAAGVTLITHGWNSGTTGWMGNWSEAIRTRLQAISGTPTLTQYTIFATADGILGPVSVTLGPRVGNAPQSIKSGEIVLLLDWSDIDVHLGPEGRDTTTVAEAVVAQLVNPVFIPDLGGHSVAELPVHLIGHSRGGSLVCELARLLGERGIWVDQVTTLDPHPLQGGTKSTGDLEGLGTPKFNWNDALPRIYTNTLFADNYHRDDETPADFDGMSVVGAYNRYLTGIVDSDLPDSADAGYFYEHSDVHLWYYGTIDTEAPTVNGDGEEITEAMRQGWWVDGEEYGAKTGFYFSQIAAHEWGTSDPRLAVGIKDGLHGVLGGNGLRYSLTMASTPRWPNVWIRDFGEGSTVFQTGAAIPFTCLFQDVDGSMSVTLLKDTDTNPYNDPPPTVIRTTESFTDLTSIFYILPRSWQTGSADAGEWFIVAKGTDGSRTRYAYWPKRITINAAPEPTPTYTPVPNVPTPTYTQTPPAGMPVVETSYVVQNLANSSAVLFGRIVSNGGAPIRHRWIGFGTSTNDLTGDVDTDINAPDGSEFFSRIVGNLTPNATYYYQAAVTNKTSPTDSDWVYGEILSFTFGENTSVTPTNTPFTAPTKTPTLTNTPLPSGGLLVSPNEDFISIGLQGGPFCPQNKEYTLKNTTSEWLNWRFSRTGDWISPVEAAGSLSAGAEYTFEVSIPLSSLPVGDYNGTLSFINETNHVGDTTLPVHLTVRNPDPACVHQTFSAPLPVSNTHIGESLALVDGDVMVGDPLAGRVYRFDGDTGEPLLTINHPDPPTEGGSGSFGYRVAAYGNDVLVAALGSSTDTINSGTVYLCDGLTGELLLTIGNPSPGNNDMFGDGLVSIGAAIAIGAQGDDTYGKNSGIVYLIQPTGNGSYTTQQVSAPNPAAFQYFGDSLASDGSLLFAGHSASNGGVAHAGAVYVFDGQSGNPIRTINNPTGTKDDSFGEPVFAVNGMLAVSATNLDAFYLFNPSTGDLIRKVENPLPGNGAYFCDMVAGYGSNLLLGVRTFNHHGFPGAGIVYSIDPFTGTLLNIIANPQPSENAAFGQTVVWTGSKIAVGAPGADSGRGVIYLMSIGECPPTPTPPPSGIEEWMAY